MNTTSGSNPERRRRSSLTMSGRLRHLTALVAVTGLLIGGVARADNWPPADLARWYILGLSYDKADAVLRLQPVSTKQLTVERGRLKLYETKYDKAVEILEQPSVQDDPSAQRLAAVARRSARSIAGAYVVIDHEHEMVVRLQDRHDQVFVPLLGDTVQKAREALRRTLGVELPRPLRVELVQDQFSLAAMTGLPLKSAQTTGTVAIANWGRVTMVSPRALPSGYPWLDTMAHELTHVALGKGTHDRAPLWLQEGVAKYMETRWRAPWPWDHRPNPDDVSVAGQRLGLGRDFDKLGPSVAMLPSAREAQVVFAQVQSFVTFVMANSQPGVLKAVVRQVALRPGNDGIDAGLRESTGVGLQTWKKRWKAHLATIPEERTGKIFEAPKADMLNAAAVARVSKLLGKRKHSDAAWWLLSGRPHQLEELSLSAWRGGHPKKAEAALSDVPSTRLLSAEVLTLRGRLAERAGHQQQAQRFFFQATAYQPASEAVACELRMAPDLPKDPIRATLCDSARRNAKAAAARAKVTKHGRLPTSGNKSLKHNVRPSVRIHTH